MHLVAVNMLCLCYALDIVFKTVATDIYKILI